MRDSSCRQLQRSHPSCCRSIHGCFSRLGMLSILHQCDQYMLSHACCNADDAPRHLCISPIPSLSLSLYNSSCLFVIVPNECGTLALSCAYKKPPILTTACSVHGPCICRFKLQEVRNDSEAHPYLLLDSREQWQLCGSHPPFSEEGRRLEQEGMDCIRAIAQHPQVARLAVKHVINVFVSGSPLLLCDRAAGDSEELCGHSILGATDAGGPWWNKQSQVGPDTTSRHR